MKIAKEKASKKTMRRFIFPILIFVCLLAPTGVEAKKEAPPPPQYPSAAEQQTFTQKYWQAVEAGKDAVEKLEQEVNGKPGQQGDMESRMLNNLQHHKAADGSEAKGFHGDPDDKGPSDWSDWDVQKDKDGNVTGFKEKDFEQKDTDGDGKISKEEREAWDKNKKKEDDERGGPPGDVDKPPDWDKDRDGKPDPGFELDCYQCIKPPLTSNQTEEDQCHGNEIGPCTDKACAANEKCEEYTETGKNQSYICHSCEEKDFCEAHGYFSDPACGGKCPPIACVPIDVDKDKGSIVPTGQTRVKGSTEKCFACMNIKRIEITWIIIIIETPYERFVLEKGKQEGFKPSSVMALAKVDQATGMIKNTMGELKSVADFLGGFNIGLGPLGLTSTGKVSMDQLSSLLTNNLNSGGSFGSNCFGDVKKEADVQAASQNRPTGAGEGTSNNRKKDKQESEMKEQQQLKTADQAGSPAVSGPIIVCGNEGRNKVLKIYDASGALIDTITQSMLKLNPNIITEKLGLAQQFTDNFIQKSGFDFAGYVEKFTGLPLKQIQSIAGQAAQIKGKVDQVVGTAAASKKKKGKEKEENPPTLPNDPLYKSVEKKQEKLFGILGSSVKPAAVVIGSSLKMGGEVLGGGSGQEEETDKITDQYALLVIGFTPWDDPNSAWNVIDANEKNVVVALVDSGLDMTHEDAPQYIWTNPKEIPGNGMDDDKDGFVDDIHGWNFLNENHDFTDVRGHGTFVAGIIAAKYNNGKGIAGINPGVVIMPIKVADDEGQTDSLSIYRGINYAVDHGAKIINVSLGGRNISKFEQQAVDRASSLGALVVIAAGNNNENLVTFGPSSSKHALSVGELNYNGERSTASNWGPNLGLVAPGEKIYSLCSKDNKHVLPSIRKAGYYKQDGTSFSTPMVTATASLILAKNPQLTNQQVADMILATAKDMGEPGWDGMTGAGLLNAAAALRSEVDQQLILMFTNLRLNHDDRDQVISVDVFGTVRGRFKEFTIDVGKGKNSTSFKTAAGPFHEQFDYQFIARLNVQDVMRGSKDWVLRIKAVDENGKERVASTPFALPK